MSVFYDYDCEVLCVYVTHNNKVLHIHGKFGFLMYKFAELRYRGVVKSYAFYLRSNRKLIAEFH